jgi:Domain of unknown function (DUF4190)/Domain of unknown function (DUF1707)
MTAAGNTGWMRASDNDRSQVQTVLNDAYAEGRITQQEWEERSTALAGPVTHADLAGLTRDLVPLPAQPRPAAYPLPTAAQPTTNGMAIASLVCGIGQVVGGPIAGIAAIILGHTARRRIRETGEQGDGMALTGLILGYIGTVGLVVLVLLAALVLAVHTSSSPGPG